MIPFLLQYHIRREDVNVTALDLLNTNVPGGISEDGIRGNCMALLHYCANWVGGLGCVPVANRKFAFPCSSRTDHSLTLLYRSTVMEGMLISTI